MSSRGSSYAGSRALLAALALCCIGLLVPALASAATGSISGTVLEASSGLPVEGVEVCAEGVAEEGFECASTAADGTYLISGLEPGSYVTEFWPGQTRPDLRTQYWDHVDGFRDATPVTVTDGATQVGIDAELKMGGSISGTVVSHRTGAPLAGVEVCSYLLGDFQLDGCTSTAANGTYRLDGLTPGAHGVFFAPSGGYVFEFYAGVYLEAEATPVAVSEGGVTSNVNASLLSESQIRGHVYQANGSTPVPGVLVCAIRAANGELWSCATSNQAGAYVVGFLPPGAYKVAFSPELSEFGEESPAAGEPGAPDAWPTQFWNLKPTLAAADLLNLPPELAAANVDARLGYVPPPATSSGAPPPVVTQPVSAAPKPLRCGKGKRKVRRHGKAVCVRARHKAHHKHHHHKGKHQRSIH